jgi:hypothetical protein
MAKGKAQVKYLGQEGLISSMDAPDWSFIYETSTVKDANFNLGDRIVLPDGREYRYAKSSSALNTSESCNFTATGLVAYTAATAAVAVGETEVTVPAATHTAVTKDELRGGFVVIFGSVSDGADMMFRGIIGNPASSADAALTLYLDGPLDVAIDTSSAYEVYQNPWAALSHTTGSPTLGKAGPPAAYVSAASTYFWCMTAGPIFQNPQSTVTENEGVGVMWRADGSLESVAQSLGATVPDVDTTQYAGFRMMGDYSGNGPVVWIRTC